MSLYTIHLEWTNQSTTFSADTFKRDHTIFFSGDQKLLNSSAPEYSGNPEASNPEELLASALASCHMLTFLTIAAKSGYNVLSYKCKAEALLDKNEEGRLAITTIKLIPTIIFSNEKSATEEQLKSLHEKAHRNCFIAQSLKTKIEIV